MVADFLIYVTEDDTVVKLLGLGMAVAVFLDATVVRMVLVPATMSLLGSWNWWLPGWMDRLLPSVEVEAGGYRLPAPAGTPSAASAASSASASDEPGTDPDDARPLVGV